MMVTVGCGKLKTKPADPEENLAGSYKTKIEEDAFIFVFVVNRKSKTYSSDGEQVHGWNWKLAGKEVHVDF